MDKLFGFTNLLSQLINMFHLANITNLNFGGEWDNHVGVIIWWISLCKCQIFTQSCFKILHASYNNPLQISSYPKAWQSLGIQTMALTKLD